MKNITLLFIILLAAFLRLYKLGQIPPSLYWDEASLGYNAFSVLKTGFDEHQKFLPVTNFAAFGDYKPPLYIYATVPSIAAFGLTEFAIRFPSALFGTLTVLLTYLLTKKLFLKKNRAFTIGRWQLDVPTTAALLLAISPWHLQFSRGAFEASLGLFFSTLGIYLFFKFEDNKFWIIPSLLSFVAAMYTFTGQRLFAPFIAAILFMQFWPVALKNYKTVTIAILISSFLFYPLFIFATRTLEGRLRFEEVTIFRNLEPINQSISDREKDNFAWWSNFIHNRRFYRLNEYLTHYFDAFNPGFLFVRGDANPRLSSQETGELYYFEGILLILGVYYLFKHKEKYKIFLIAWVLISPLGPATARETPHALRMIHMLPSLQIIAAYGLVATVTSIKHKKLFAAAIALVAAFNVSHYVINYYINYPKNYSSEWQYGYRQAVAYVKSNASDADYVVVTKGLGRPYIYFLLYNNFDPVRYWATATVTRDKFYFLDVSSFDKYIFVDSTPEAQVHGKVIYVTTGEEPEDAVLLTKIKDLSGKDTFSIYQKTVN